MSHRSEISSIYGFSSQTRTHSPERAISPSARVKPFATKKRIIISRCAMPHRFYIAPLQGFASQTELIALKGRYLLAKG